MDKELENVLKQIDISKSFLHDVGNGILLSNEEEIVLTNYQIDYKNCKSIEELIFKIEDYLNDSNLELPDLDNLSSRLSEYNYYNNTNK